MTKHRVALFHGSLRRAGTSRLLGRKLRDVAPASLDLVPVEIAELPLYNADREAEAPGEWLELRAAIRAADAVLFVTPEYNRSIPGGLKNAIDIGSRPKEANAWAGKPAAVVSFSQGALGGFGANHDLRRACVVLDMPAMGAPEAYIGGAGALFDAEGRMVNAGTQAYLADFMAAFAAWIERTG